MTSHDPSAFIVVDFWRVRPGQRAALERALAEAAAQFREQEGILSVDFTTLADDPDRYLVVFRYANAATREAFVATPQLKESLARLSAYWDLDSPVYQGQPIST